MTLEEEIAIRDRLALLAGRQGGMKKAVAEEFAFHLTDWLDDLRNLHAICHSREWEDQKGTWESIIQFVVHAPAHMAAAHRILGGQPLEDTFQLGAVKGTGDPRRKPGGDYPNE